MEMHVPNITSNINGNLSVTIIGKIGCSFDPPGLRLSGLITQVPNKLKIKDPTPITQELIPAAKPGFCGRTWNARIKFPVIYLQLTAIPTVRPKTTP